MSGGLCSLSDLDCCSGCCGTHNETACNGAHPLLGVTIQMTLRICDAVGSQNKGTPIWTQKYDSPFCGDPKMVPLILGNPHATQSRFTRLKASCRPVAAFESICRFLSRVMVSIRCFVSSFGGSTGFEALDFRFFKAQGPLGLTPRT